MGGRTERRARKTARKIERVEKMVRALEAAWRRPVKYTCENCLCDAYQSVVTGTNGYITDEELMASSGNTLRWK